MQNILSRGTFYILRNPQGSSPALKWLDLTGIKHMTLALFTMCSDQLRYSGYPTSEKTYIFFFGDSLSSSEILQLRVAWKASHWALKTESKTERGSQILSTLNAKGRYQVHVSWNKRTHGSAREEITAVCSLPSPKSMMQTHIKQP